MTDPSADTSIDKIREAIDAGRLDAADELVRLWRRSYPSSVDWVSAAVEIAVRRGDPAAAERTMAALPPGVPDNSEVHYARALIQKARKRTSEARRSAYLACNAHPLRAAPWVFLADIEASRKHWGSAFIAAGHAVRFSPERRDLSEKRLLYARRLAGLIGSDALIDDASVDAFEEHFKKLERAWRLEILGHSADAETAFADVLDRRPDFKSARIGLMKSAYRQWAVSRMLSSVFRPTPSAWMRAVMIFAFFGLFVRLIVRVVTRSVESIQETGLLYVLGGAAIYFVLSPGSRFLESLFFLSPRGFAVARGRDRFAALCVSTAFFGSIAAAVSAVRSDRFEPLLACCLFGFAARWPATMASSGVKSAYLLGIIVTSISVVWGGLFLFLERLGGAHLRDPLIVAAGIFLAVLSPILARQARSGIFRPA